MVVSINTERQTERDKTYKLEIYSINNPISSLILKDSVNEENDIEARKKNTCIRVVEQ